MNTNNSHSQQDMSDEMATNKLDGRALRRSPSSRSHEEHDGHEEHSQHDTPDALLQQWHVEIHNEASPASSRSQTAHSLRDVDGMD